MRLPLLLSLLLCAPLLWAQEETEEETTEQPEAQAESQERPAATPPPRSEESPFDYEASEQISEDLSVSFPVDI